MKSDGCSRNGSVPSSGGASLWIHQWWMARAKANTKSMTPTMSAPAVVESSSSSYSPRERASRRPHPPCVVPARRTTIPWAARMRVLEPGATTTGTRFISRQRKLAVAMALHPRLGERSPLGTVLCGDVMAIVARHGVAPGYEEVLISHTRLKLIETTNPLDPREVPVFKNHWLVLADAGTFELVCEWPGSPSSTKRTIATIDFFGSSYTPVPPDYDPQVGMAQHLGPASFFITHHEPPPGIWFMAWRGRE
mmetsp:Transcript_80702/g.216311  ORF Transcript_80702/g.216311 Transcript_80702/m.216311 type:complete len:251 (+) Transcript_80702:148-900(+)